MKILIVVPDLNLGGVTTALVSFANELIKHGNNVSVMNMDFRHERNESFDKEIKLLNLRGKARYWQLGKPMVQHEHNILRKVKLICLGAVKKALNRSSRWLRCVFKGNRLDEKYDIVIAYKQCAPCYTYVLWCCEAKKKIAFVHGTVEDMGNISSWDHYLYSFDKVAYVSNAVKDGFIRKYPKLKCNATTIYNMLDSHSIIQRAQEECEVCFNKGAINIVTISRIENSQKGTDRIAPICKHLKESGITNFAWYIVGDGPDFELCKKQAEELEVTDVLFFLGAKTNPYPYLKAADFSVLPTKGESFGLVVVESLIVGTPPIVCDYPALKELLQDDFNGIIVPQDVDKLYEAVKKMVEENAFFERIRNNCLNYSCDNEYIYQQFLEAVK